MRPSHGIAGKKISGSGIGTGDEHHCRTIWFAVRLTSAGKQIVSDFEPSVERPKVPSLAASVLG
jgi:hypothetical protein